MSRDQTVFVDDDGRAYHFYSSENNATLYISELTDDYQRPSGRYTRNFVKESREAPAVFKRNGKYYMLSSGCTGWDPNQAELAVADSIMGEWKTIGNPCTGTDADKTFYAQSTYVQKVMGKKDMYIAMFDRWKTHVMYGFHSPSKVIKSPFPGVTNGTSTALPIKAVLKPAKELSC